MKLTKSASVADVVPGQQFNYAVQFQCTAAQVSGCFSAILTDALPDGLTITGEPTMTGGVAGDIDHDDTSVTVTFTDDLGGGKTGIAAGRTATLTIPVQLDADYPYAKDGVDLVNTAKISADNAATKQAKATVTPQVPLTLGAETSKQIDPASALASPGAALAVSLTGTNTSNSAVDSLTLSDPVDPAATPNPFTYLGLDSLGEVTLPAGAETVQVRAYVDGAWVDGQAGSSASLPAGVDPADVTGVQFVFASTDGEGITPNATSGVVLNLTQRDNVSGLTEATDVNNSAGTTVTLDAASAASDPATDTYRILPADLDVMAGKAFEPDTVAVGDPSTVTLSARNTSANAPLDSLTITEPAAASPNPFEDGELTFTGLGTDDEGTGIVWPTGADEAEITYECAGSPGSPRSTRKVDSLPAPPAQCAPVTGFTVTFTGRIVPGALTTIPFGVRAATEQAADEIQHDNTVAVQGSSGAATARDTATAVLTTIKHRLAVDVDKSIHPASIPSNPGQIATAQLRGTLEDFPASTTDAHQIIVSDPADFASDEWYDAFRPVRIVATPIPAEATLTVQYWDGSTWTDVDGMTDVSGPGYLNADLPETVRDGAEGIRFVYEFAKGFPPGTTVAPNLAYALRPDMAGSDASVSDCAAVAAHNGALSAAAAQTQCPEITLVPPDPGSADPIDKSWNRELLNARSQQRAKATLSWSTNAFTGVSSMSVTDSADPSATPLADSVYDVFDLVSIDAITSGMDPHLTYDEITKVELYRLAEGSTDPASGSWHEAANDPCPQACDGSFPGVTLTDAERADTIGFRLTYVESPTRIERSGHDPSAPPVGSGVAASTGNDRHIRPVFQLRDELRSDSEVPVTADRVYNITGRAGEIRNTARATGYQADDSVLLDGTDSDDIALVNVPVTTKVAKRWTGGPLGIPQDGVPADDWPTSRVTITAQNTTPAKVDQLTITEPGGGTNAFDTFNLIGLTSMTAPASIGATDVTVALTKSDTTTKTYSRSEALALTEAQLADVVGLTITYTGRIDAGATATVGMDFRLRSEARSDGAPPTAGQTIDNTVDVEVADLIDYPGIDPRTVTDNASASVKLTEQGIGVVAEKSFDPTSQTEPDRSPVTVTLGARPSGPSRTTVMTLTDTDASFWNQYDLTALEPIGFTKPIDQVRVDALVGGTWSLDEDGDPVLTGAHWETGSPVIAPETTMRLPDAVTADQVQGLRFTLTRTDGRNWENPANPKQEVSFTVQRRVNLHTGGPVPSDLAGSDPAPGETTAGEATDTIQARVISSDVDVDGDPLTSTADATATLDYRHATNAVQVTKAPDGDVVQPGKPFTYTLTIKNTGDVPISNPVVIDRLPIDDEGPVLRYPEVTESSRYTFQLSPKSSADTALPTEPDQVTVVETPMSIMFTFPEGSELQVGETYTISFDMQTRPGLAAHTEFTNGFGVTGDRAWDDCSGTLDEDTGECRAAATNSVQSAGALAVHKLVKADGSDQLGVTVDPSVDRAVRCRPDQDGFFARPCIPLAKPGGAVTWRMHFVNTGNRPIDRIVAVDRLPAPGDALATVPALARGSQWRPLLEGARPELAGLAGTLHVYYTTEEQPCTDDLGTDDTACAPGSWVEWATGTRLPVDADTVTGIKIEILADTALAPAGTLNVDLAMTAPAFSPTAGADTIAYNTVGMSGRWIDGAKTGYTLTTEPPRVGVALATGPVQVVKTLTGAAAAQYAPDSFAATLSCTSVGQEVPLGDRAALTLTRGQPVTVRDLPYAASCTVTEGDHGQSATSTTTATVSQDISNVQVVTLTNRYDYASLTVTKHVDTSAVDADGTPVSYGPFGVSVACTYLGEQVYADGYGTDHPMTATLSDGESVTFDMLPATADCTITETNDRGAETTTITTAAAGDSAPKTEEGAEATITLAADNDGVNTAVIANEFEVGALHLRKEVTGELAQVDGTGPFTLAVSCTLTDASGTREVWDGTVVLGGEQPLEKTIGDIAAGAQCAVTETDDGAASTVAIDPTEPVTIGVGETATVTVMNRFDAGALELVKEVSGPAAGFAPSEFQARVTCRADGRVLPGFPKTVSVRPGTPTTVQALVGSTCVVGEIDSGGATQVSYDPAGGRAVSAPVQIGANEPVRVVISNEYRAGGLRIAKTVDGPGQSLGRGPFRFEVACAFDGDETAFTDTLVLRRHDAEQVLVSDPMTGLPVGAVCDVTEVGSAGADSTPAPVTVTIPDVDADGVAQVVTAGFVNVYSAAKVQVAKVITGAGREDAAGLTFTVAVTCQIRGPEGGLLSVYAGSVQVHGGQTVVVSNADGRAALVPAGAHCFAEETDAQGADANSVDFSSYDDAAVVRKSDSLQTLTITVTNRFNADPPDQEPPDQQPPDQQPPDQEPPDQEPPDQEPPSQEPPEAGKLPGTGAPPLAGQALAGLVLLGLGLALAGRARRRWRRNQT